MATDRDMTRALGAAAAGLLALCLGLGCGPTKRVSSHEGAEHPSTEAQGPPAKPSPPAVKPETVSNADVRVAHGAELYGRICAVCHGPEGEGYKADNAPAIGRPGYLRAVSDAFLRTAIADGRSGSTMSPWSQRHGGPLSDGDVDALIAFMRSWQRLPPLQLDESPLRGDAVAGAKHYTAECARCHGRYGNALTAVRIGHPAWLASASNGLLRQALREGRPGTTMESFRKRLGDQGIEDVVAHVRTFAKHPQRTPRPPPMQPAPLPLGKLPLNPKGPPPEGFQAHPGRTGADVVHAQLARGARMALLDARPPPDYAREHIAGAVSVPYYDPSPYLDDLPRDTWLVSYCHCPHAESRELARKLVEAGFSKVTVLDEGLGYWKKQGYGIQTGATQGKP